LRLLALVNSDVELLGKRIENSRLLWTPNRGEGFVVSLVVNILAANFIKILALGQSSKAFIRATPITNIF